MDGVNEIEARIAELMAMHIVIDQRVATLRVQSDDLIRIEAEAEARPTVVAAGRYQWPVPDQPAIELAASLDPVTRKCSLCAYRHPVTFIRTRASAAYLGKKPPHETTKCLGCDAIFLPPSTFL